MRIDTSEVELGDDYIWRHQDEPFTGTTEERTADGVLLHENEFNGGALDGLSRTYWPDGSLRQESWHDFGIELRARSWYRNGQIQEDAVRNSRGPVRHDTWAEDGTPTGANRRGLRRRQRSSPGRALGVRSLRRAPAPRRAAGALDGTASRIRVPVDDLDEDDVSLTYWRGERFSGISEERYPDGTLRFEIEHTNGIPDGLSRSYRPDGRLHREMWLDYGVRVRSRSWYPDGQLEEDICTAASSLPKHTTWAEDGTVTRCDVGAK